MVYADGMKTIILTHLSFHHFYGPSSRFWGY